MIYVLFYLAIGLANYWHFVGKGGAILFTGGDSRVAGLVEAAFFILAWPVQAAFLVFVGLNMLTDAVLGRMFR